ncbi:MAG: hypothetical protein J6X66_09405 [Lachnospiraceae bacterium]|nr:hypothetical protein [Lachnospiraceae bacterium]
MPLMDEFKEEREKIKKAPLKAKWKYFVDYYLKWVIGGAIVIGILIAVIVTTVTHKKEMLYVSLLNFRTIGLVEQDIEIPFSEEHLENTKKQEITLDSTLFVLGKRAEDAAASGDQTYSALYNYEDEQKISMILVVGQVDLMISGEDVIDRYTESDFLKPLTDVYSAAELKSFEEKGMIKSANGVPVAICMDGSKMLKEYYEYTADKNDKLYAAYTYGEHTALAKEFVDFLGY